MATPFSTLDPELRPMLARDALRCFNHVLSMLPPRTELRVSDILGMTLLIAAAGPMAPPNDNDE